MAPVRPCGVEGLKDVGILVDEKPWLAAEYCFRDDSCFVQKTVGQTCLQVMRKTIRR